MAHRLPKILPRLAVLVLVALAATAGLTFAAGSSVPSAPAVPAVDTAPAPPLIVPDVRNQAFVFAKGTLADAGFAWKVDGSVHGYAANVVIDQYPKGGTRLIDTGSPVIRLTLKRNGSYKQVGDAENTSPYAGTIDQPSDLAGNPIGPVNPVQTPPTSGPAAKAPKTAPATAPAATAPAATAEAATAPAATAPATTVAAPDAAQAPTTPAATTPAPTTPAATTPAATTPAATTPATTPATTTPTTPAKSAKAATPATKPAAKATTAASWPKTRPVAFVVPGARKEPLDEMPLVDRANALGTWLDTHKTMSAAAAQYWLYQNAWVVTGAQMGWWHGAEALQALIAVDARTESLWGIGSKSEAVARQALAEVRAKAKS